MANDKIIGGIMASIGLVGIIYELYYLIISPLVDNAVLGTLNPRQWWAVAIPLFLFSFGVLGIILWIGVTMIKTPPPEAWDFDEDAEDEEIAS